MDPKDALEQVVIQPWQLSDKCINEGNLRAKLREKHGPDFFRFFETAVKLATMSTGNYISEYYTENLDAKVEYEYDCLMSNLMEGLRTAKWKIVAA